MPPVSQVVVQIIADASQYAAGVGKAVTMTKGMASDLQSGTNQLVSGFKNGAQEAESFGSKISGLAGRMGTLLLQAGTVYLGIHTLFGAIGAGIGEVKNLDENMRNIQSITLDTDASIAGLKQQLLDMVLAGQSAGRSASELAAAMYELVSAGYSAEEALYLAQISAEGAAAGLSTTDTASKVLLATLQAYHLPVTQAKQVMDSLFTTVDLGVIHFDQLANGMGYVIPTAASLGVPLDQLGAAIALLTRQGQMGTRVMTNINDVLTRFIKPNKDLAAAIKAAGFESGSAMIKALGFVGAVKKIGEEADGSDDKLAQWFGDVRAIRAILPLTANDTKDFTDMLKEFDDEMAKGSRTDLAFIEQKKSLNFALSQMTSVLKALFVELAEHVLPILIKGVRGFTDLALAIADGVNWLFKHKEALKVVELAFAALAALLGTGVVLGLIGFIGQLVLIGPILGVIALGLAALTSPIGLVVAAFLAFELATGSLGKTFQEVKAKAEELAHFFKLGFEGGKIGGDIDIFNKIFFTLGDTVHGVWTKLGELKEKAQEVAHFFGLGIEGGKIGGDIGGIETAAFNAGAKLASLKKDIEEFVTDKVKEAGQFFSGLKGDIEDLGKKIEAGDFKGLGSALGGALATALSTGIEQALKGAFAAIDWTKALVGLGGGGNNSGVSENLKGMFKDIDWVKVGKDAAFYTFEFAFGFIAALLDPNQWIRAAVVLVKHWQDTLGILLFFIFAPEKVMGPLIKVLERVPFAGKFMGWFVETLYKILRPLGRAIEGFAGDLFRALGKGLLEGLGKFAPDLPFFKAILEAFTKGGPSLLNDLKTRLYVWIVDAFEAVGRFIGERGPKQLRQAIEKMFENLDFKASWIWERMIKPAFDFIFSKVNEVRLAGKWVIETYIDALMTMKDFVVDGIKAVIQWILDTFGVGTFLENIKGVGVTIGKALIDAIKGARAVVWDLGSTYVKWIKGEFAQLADAMFEIGVKAGKKLLEGIASLPGIKQLKTMSGKLGSLGSWLSGLAEGGLITRPTLAVLGEDSDPELVLPLTKPGRIQELLRSLNPSLLGNLLPKFTAPSGGTPSGNRDNGTNLNFAPNVSVTDPDQLKQLLLSCVDDLDRQMRYGAYKRGASLNGRLMIGV